METVRINFKRLRENSKLNQQQFASFLGIDQSLISKFEKGERQLSVSVLEKACALFGCQMYDLKKEEMEPMFKVSFRIQGDSKESLDSIVDIHRIALDLIEMSKIKEINER